MEHTKEFWLEVYSQPDLYAATLAEEYKLHGDLLSITKQISELAKEHVLE